MKANDPHLPPGEHHRWGLHTPLVTHFGPKRPLGVSIIAVVFWIAAGFFALAFLLAFLPFTPGQGAWGQPSPGQSAFSGTVQEPQAGAGAWSADTAIQVAVALVLAVVFSVIGLGLWRLRPWGRMAAMAMPAVTLVLLVLANLVHPLSIGMQALLVLGAALALYLLRGDVAAAFHATRREATSRQVQ